MSSITPTMAQPALENPPVIKHFITQKGDKLYDGEQEYRFVSFNVPCLHYIEDDMQFENPMPFRFPNSFEIEDALKTVHYMGGNVVRTYTLSVRREMDWDTRPVHILGPDTFNEEAFVALDHVLAQANKWGIRLILPIINGATWWGGHGEFAAFFDKNENDFFTDPLVIEAFKKIVHYVLNRTNTVTGVQYKDDKAILAWETGNELGSPIEWSSEICRYIKGLDSNHLTIDGNYHRDGTEPQLRESTVNDDSIDFVQTHHYEKEPIEIIQNIRNNAALARGKKPYHVGEIGFVSTAGLEAVLDTVIEEGMSGALIWSLRRHHKDGGFFWHHEPHLGGDFFKAYHFPGFNSGEDYDERAIMAMIREKAFQIRGLPVPAHPIPDAPELLQIESVDPHLYDFCFPFLHNCNCFKTHH